MAEAMAPEAADAEVAGQILGISRTAFKDGVARTTIRLYEGATPLTLIEEKLEGDASVMMRNPGKRAWLLEALRDVERTHEPTNGIGCANSFGNVEAPGAARL